MQWHDIFPPVNNLSPDGARAFFSDHDAADRQILDVRQPDEYLRRHLPSARLIPIKELADRAGELDPVLPTLVYCAVGGRSRVAAQMLAAKGFSQVYNLAGGIRAWEGAVVTGAPEQDFELIAPDADFISAWALAWAMEDGLEKFYLQLAAMLPPDDGRSELCRRMAAFESSHKKMLESRRRDLDGTIAGVFLDNTGQAGQVEGGLTGARLLALVAQDGVDAPAILSTAMALEAQAMDLYSRLARRQTDTDTADFFSALAGEEKKHLESVTSWLEAKGAR